ncbi:MAG: cellulase family glycosylhydrolase [Archangium sp.]|nr:cellulase family glycosylhydrolase [Archangium sp.]MDP3572211.1 cellulase family glycosylhydrolase [Archangium sp.]
MKIVVAVSAVVCALALAGCGPEEQFDETAVASTRAALTGPMPYRGVNLAGADFGVASDGTGQNPGTFGSTYTWPSATSADYFLAKGMNTFRVPFRWERLQRTLGAAFDAAELSRMRTTVNGITSRGGVVLLDPHNYARYGTAFIGSGSVSHAQFADFWSRLAHEFKSNPNVLFGLMNEPYGLPTEQWVTSANAAIVAIRATGATNLILVPGNAWTGAHSWTQNWYGTANSVALLAIRDSGNNVAFEAHQYFDSNYSGAADSCTSTSAGAAQLGAFTQWLRANGKKGFLGEFATGSNATCLAALENLLTYLDANTDVYLGWTWWAAGPWWGNAWTSLEPTSTGADKPQMDVMERHLSSTTTPPSCTDGARNGTETGVDCGGSCAACVPTTSCTDGARNGNETGVDCGGSCKACTAPSACTEGVFEAETAFHSTGGPTSGGWNLWSNGYLQTTSSITGVSSLIVSARGSSAGGVWPRMTVSVGGRVLGTVTVSNTTWSQYRLTVPAGATGQIRVSFDNDAIIRMADRNLSVDKISTRCP